MKKYLLICLSLFFMLSAMKAEEINFWDRAGNWADIQIDPYFKSPDWIEPYPIFPKIPCPNCHNFFYDGQAIYDLFTICPYCGYIITQDRDYTGINRPPIE